MQKIKKQKKILLCLIVAMIGTMFSNVKFISAAETATVRIISTTDLHGQLANTNYDTAGEKNVGSLAQDFTLIKEARKEIKYGTSLTVDVGDTIYGFGSDYIRDQNGTEYMYAAIAKMGYDAITLGNHDFDYGYQYVKKQLEKEKIDDICVLSNVYDAVTKKNVWNENKLLKKTVTTSKGKKVTVKIGIVGVTRPGLTNYYNHTGILITEDIIKSTQEQVKKLKDKGADLIVVLAHSGIGKENPEENSGDVSYAISKIDGVDAVMCGHSHLNFPSKDARVETYYNLPNVSKETGLMNGKPVVMVEDHGAGIGIADLKIKITNGKISLVNSKAHIKYATKETVCDSVVLKYEKVYDKKIGKVYREKVAKLDKGETINNYFGLIEDNKAIQLINEAKIKLGLKYTHTKNTEYKNYPVIAVSTYKKYGVESKDDYVNIDGDITMADVLSIQSYYHDYPYIYWITGKQLREWLEWVASAYEISDSTLKSGDEIINRAIKEKGMKSLIKKEWMDDWSKFFLFDGVEYEIDITKPAKYEMDGTIRNAEASRIRRLSYNGSDIADDTKLILVSDIITQSRNIIAAPVAKQRLYKCGEYSANLLKDYLKELSQFGDINTAVDNNWKLLLPSTNNYIIRSSALSEKVAENQEWYQETLDISENFAYYRAKFDMPFQDENGPTVVISPNIQVKTDQDVPVAVQANDASGIINLRYAAGLYDASDMVWSSGLSSMMLGNEFLAKENGIYSVWAMDRAGNRTVKYIKITNINRGVLQIPKVNRVTNKSNRITGCGEPGATIKIKANGKTYRTTVDEEGVFSRKIGYQKADEKIQVNQTGTNGKSSEYVVVKVLRAGPNYPTVKEITNKDSKITAEINDVNSQIVAMIDNSIYVSKDGGKEAFKSSPRYDKNLNVIETDYERNGNEVTLSIPVQYAGTNIKIYVIDHIGRINYPVREKVKKIAPEMPVLYTACDGEQYVYGYVPESNGILYEINVTIGDRIYNGICDPSGCFRIKVEKLTEGDIIYATALDIVNDTIRESASGSRTIRSYSFYGLVKESVRAFVEPMTDNDTVVKGKIINFTGTAYLKVGNAYYDLEVDKSKTFEITLEKPLRAREVVCIVLRNEFSNIIEAEGIEVTMALPDKPTLVNKAIYTTTKTVKIKSSETCKACVKIGNKVYTSEERTWDEDTGLYTYFVTIEKSKADKSVYIYMENETGKSKRIKTMVIEKEKETEKEK